MTDEATELYLRAPGAGPRVDVETPNGTLRGSAEGDLLRFRGIRYASADRFAPPVAEPAWTGVREALVEGPTCPQPRFGMVILAQPKRIPPMSENCHFLNITAPADATPDAPKPVMVWIHGGSYVNGSGGGEIYDPSRLVRNGDVIVVGINYRLGVFGYLPLPGVAEANLGVRDQLMALQWVHDNIASFGGDPERVTLFGQSAGADSIVQLLAMPEADHLYTRVIVQSAPLGLDKGREAIAEQLGRNVLAALEPGVTPATATEEQLIAAQLEATGGITGDRLSVGMPYAPTPGVWPVASTADRSERLAKRAAEVEVLIGYARDDFTPFFESVPALRRAQESAILRPATVPVAAELTRRVFGAPALALAKLLAESGGTVYTYRFDWRPKGTPWGACHCIDLPFVWADERFWRGSPMLGGTAWSDLEAFGVVVQRQWARFAREGVPDAGWPTYEAKRPIGRRIDFARRS
ncbi:para-nitrobenzyl esterase [Subtercola sp. Z020]|uniref:carboxylesterase/lipase family protein n=1 Tax=Subtercola sp. Z020 TaxID=2080582 RepID=UPI000CE84B2A|nr:carboxylesterase family protein [Subtercola sp. Z020]PPF80164.1 para-nitrobenzyl esterase [Subtercola sp. Z020]